LEGHDCNLVLLTFVREKSGLVLRLLIEKKDSDPALGSGVDLKLCSSVSRKLDAALEADDFIGKAFFLEVSSPGIERPLTCEDDFKRFAGREVRIKTSKALDGKKKFQGLLLGVNSSSIKISLAKEKEIDIPFELVGKANLVFDPKRSKRK